MILTLALVGGLVWKFIDFLKYVSAGAWTQTKTQAIVWGGGIAAIFLVAQTQFGSVVSLNGVSLLKMSGWDKVLLGFMASSLFASVPVDLKKALDVHDTASVPPLAFGPVTMPRRANATTTQVAQSPPSTKTGN